MADKSLEEQLADVRAKKEQLELQKQLQRNKDSTKISKEDTRLRILIGTAVLADLEDALLTEAFSTKKEILKAILDKYTPNKSHREFLKRYDFINDDEI